MRVPRPIRFHFGHVCCLTYRLARLFAWETFFSPTSTDGCRDFGYVLRLLQLRHLELHWNAKRAMQAFVRSFVIADGEQRNSTTLDMILLNHNPLFLRFFLSRCACARSSLLLWWTPRVNTLQRGVQCCTGYGTSSPSFDLGFRVMTFWEKSCRNVVTKVALS